MEVSLSETLCDRSEGLCKNEGHSRGRYCAGFLRRTEGPARPTNLGKPIRIDYEFRGDQAATFGPRIASILSTYEGLLGL